MTLTEIFEALKQVDEQLLVQIFTNALSAAAPQVVALTARLSGISEETLLDDPDVGPAGIAEILQVVWEINDLKNLWAALGQCKALLAPRTKPGSSD